MTRVYVCSCFGITEQQVKQHADDGRCTPRQIASACKAGTDCGSCVKRIQSLLGRGDCTTRSTLAPTASATETVTASVTPMQPADPTAAPATPAAARAA